MCLQVQARKRPTSHQGLLKKVFHFVNHYLASSHVLLPFDLFGFCGHRFVIFILPDKLTCKQKLHAYRKEAKTKQCPGSRAFTMHDGYSHNTECDDHPQAGRGLSFVIDRLGFQMRFTPLPYPSPAIVLPQRFLC